MCEFCNAEAKKVMIDNSSCVLVDCPNCGKYAVTSVFELDIRNIDSKDKIRLSQLLAEHKLKKVSPIVFASSQVGQLQGFVWTNYLTLLEKYPKEAIEIIDRSLLNLSRLVKHPSDNIRITQSMTQLFFSTNINGVGYIIRQLANQGYTTMISSYPNDITIEAEGWRRIEELKRTSGGMSNQAFVAMWFDNSVEEFYKNGIRKAIEDTLEYKVVRVDLLEHNNKICDQIIAEINKSKLLIADFTGNRGGVYFEAGYALGLKIPVIWTVHENSVTQLHFDTRQYNHIVYKDVNELYNKLKSRIEATVLSS